MTAIQKTSALLVLLLLAGCAATGGPERMTVLRIPSPQLAATGQRSPRSIMVAPVQSRGLTADRRYVYLDDAAPAELRQASTLFWEEPPSRSLERALVGALRAHFTSVAGPDTTVLTDDRVIARLERFEEETGTARPARATVAFEVTAVDNAAHRVGLTGRYCASAPIGGPAPSDRANAFSEALSTATGAFAHDLAAGTISSSAC